jgi:squalene synthase HpnC
MSTDHYENFPVASALCPPALRPAVKAIYWFARTADDIADEGTDSPAQRTRDLHAYRAELHAVAAGAPPGPRWAGVFGPLQPVLKQFALPLPLLEDLLSAFEQDVHKTRYTDRAELLDYCRRSANPVGRLLLHLYGISGHEALRQSDAICTALQLANFWQDLGADTRRGRLYAPLEDCARFRLSASEVMTGREDRRTSALVRDLVEWTRALMHSGAPLVHSVPGRTGWELRLVVQGGLRILEKIERMKFDTLTARPVVGATDAPVLLWRALRMKRDASASLHEVRP